MNIIIIASGQEYQNAAAWAAPTYVRNLGRPGTVTILLPEKEEPTKTLKEHSERFGFAIGTFSFKPVEGVRYPMQLKCLAFWHAVSSLNEGEMLFIVDSDTCCCRPLSIERHLETAILEGRIGLVRDLRDRHTNDFNDPWYLPQGERDTYVNAGVILASSKALDIFRLALDLSRQPQFANPQFGDQTIINFVLGKYHKGRLLLLDKVYNAMHYRHPNHARFIAHFAGYKTPSEKSRRLAAHQRLCIQILDANNDQPPRRKNSAP